jgi:hypothetical protein
VNSAHTKKSSDVTIGINFSDFFEVRPVTIEKYGAFNVSLLADLPLFIDPFLLFNSNKRAYRKLHDQIITYLKFLKDKATNENLPRGLIDAWYRFPEIKQNWFGFSVSSNRGSGLGKDFARALHKNLHRIFADFGEERVTHGSHLEKLCLIEPGIGKDNISDFTTNLIHEFLLEYTQAFAKKYIAPKHRRSFIVSKVRFNYNTERWEHGVYDLPNFRGDYVLLTPTDILTKDDTWINRSDLLSDFDLIPMAIPDEQLRAQVSNYFMKMLPRGPRKKQAKKYRIEAAALTLQEFPKIIDYYIRYKEEHGDEAEDLSLTKVAESRDLYVIQLRQMVKELAAATDFYKVGGNTYDEAMERVLYLKDVIENKDGYRVFYLKGRPIEREEDLQILYRLTWRGTPSDVNREVNNGRGPVDFKVSRGSADKTLVEFKLAKNTQLQRNLANQVSIYEKANDAKRSIKVILYFTRTELARVQRILKALKLTHDPNIVLIDARNDNKPSASKA